MVLTFINWLRQQTHRNDAIGDLAADCERDQAEVRSILQLRDRMIALGGCPEAFEALDRALEEWRKKDQP
jgi:hypothetical protein